MFRKLLPKTTDFFAFFQRHVELVVQAAQLLLEMLSQAREEPVQQAERITALEKKADTVTHECIDALHSTFITPIERDDIYRLITRMDDILDAIEDISARIVLYRLDTYPHEVSKMGSILCLSLESLQTIVQGLSQHDTRETMLPSFKRVHQLENEADLVVRQAIGNLFDQEKDPIRLIKWKEVYENLEDAVDCCESVAHIVEGIMIENS